MYFTTQCSRADALTLHVPPPLLCGSCVWSIYFEQRREHEAALAALVGEAPPEDPFEALERKLAEARCFAWVTASFLVAAQRVHLQLRLGRLCLRTLRCWGMWCQRPRGAPVCQSAASLQAAAAQINPLLPSSTFRQLKRRPSSNDGRTSRCMRNNSGRFLSSAAAAPSTLAALQPPGHACCSRCLLSNPTTTPHVPARIRTPLPIAKSPFSMPLFLILRLAPTHPLPVFHRRPSFMPCCSVPALLPALYDAAL